MDPPWHTDDSMCKDARYVQSIPDAWGVIMSQLLRIRCEGKKLKAI